MRLSERERSFVTGTQIRPQIGTRVTFNFHPDTAQR